MSSGAAFWSAPPPPAAHNASSSCFIQGPSTPAAAAPPNHGYGSSLAPSAASDAATDDHYAPVDRALWEEHLPTAAGFTASAPYARLTIAYCNLVKEHVTRQLFQSEQGWLERKQEITGAQVEIILQPCNPLYCTVSMSGPYESVKSTLWGAVCSRLGCQVIGECIVNELTMAYKCILCVSLSPFTHTRYLKHVPVAFVYMQNI
jgi:hypothetical protein